MNSSKLNEYIKFNITKLNKNNLGYNFDLKFRNDKMIECHIITENYLFLESNVTVKFKKVLPFVSDNKVL